MFEVRYPIHDDRTGRTGALRLAGGIWTGDVCGFEFADTVYGLSGTATCDWREPGPRLWLDDGLPTDPNARTLLDRLGQLLLPFHRGAFRHLTQRDVRHGPTDGDTRETAAPAPFAAGREPLQLAPLLDQVLHLTGPHKVLDIGCATGAVVQGLRQRGVDAHGFDVCLAAGAKAPPFVRGGALDAFPFGSDEGFDTLLALDLFEHVPEHLIGAMVGECARLGARHIVTRLSLCEFHYAGHVTLRPLSWWDRQLAPWFHRVAPAGQRELVAACDADPARYLRVYELASVPAAV